MKSKTCLFIRRVGTILVLFLTVPSLGWADVANLKMTEVRPSTGEVEITNVGTANVTLSNNLPFCHRFNYASSIPSGSVFAPGESKVFQMNLNADSSDVWLYRDSNFSNPGSILTGMQYGSGNIGRTSVAVSAGAWPSSGAFVSTPSTDKSLRLMALDPTDPENWAAGEPVTGAFFGTGEPIEDPIPGLIEKSEISVELDLLVDGLVSPLGLQDPNDGTGRLFVFDQTGLVWIVESGSLQSEPLMDVSGRLVSLNADFDERGLLGFVLHPGFPEIPRVYTHTSEPMAAAADFTVPNPGQQSMNHQAVIAEWELDPADPNRIAPQSRRELMRIDQPQSNHNGGTLAFGPGGYLYISLGDGGGSDDTGFGHGPVGNSQDLGVIHGGVLRIDPDGDNSANGQYGIPDDNPFLDVPDALDEFYAYGLRNPYIFSFDQQTGQMFIGDAGQNDIEPIYIGESGANFGWRLTEGSFFFDPDSSPKTVTLPLAPLPADLVNPIAQYPIPREGSVVIGGYVYRGQSQTDLDGRYIFGDWTGRIFFLDEENQIRELVIGREDRALGMMITGFGQDASGDVYVLGSDSVGPTGDSGRVYRLTSLPDALRLRITDVESTDGIFRIGFTSSFPPANHQIETRGSLEDPDDPWIKLKEPSLVQESDRLFKIEFPIPDDSKRFYRIIGFE